MIEALKTVMHGQTLTAPQAEEVMLAILANEVRPEQIGALLAALHFRPPVGAELFGFARVLRAKARGISDIFAQNTRPAIDVCGTGGDGLGTFNVSTTVAFVSAAAGQPIAKHGNRSVSSRCGSFDVLEKLGIPFISDADAAKTSLARFNLAFLYAPSFHPALGTLAPIRKSLGVRTVFNALGPLANPAGVRRQLIGVYSRDLLLPMAEALASLGADEAMIVRGEDGNDEISLAGATRVAHLRDGQISEFVVRPEELGLRSAPASAISGGDAEENARLLRAVLSGESGTYRDIVVLNSAAALVVGRMAEDLHEGLAQANCAIDSGRALEILEGMAE